jgi:hypothetical protein
MDREAFIAVLDQLTLPQIEARLPLWDAEQLKFAEEYLDRNGVKYTQMEQDTRPNTESASAVTATKSYKMATIALIIAIGAMLAAIASGLIALEALQAR